MAVGGVRVCSIIDIQSMVRSRVEGVPRACFLLIKHKPRITQDGNRIAAISLSRKLFAATNGDPLAMDDDKL